MMKTTTLPTYCLLLVLLLTLCSCREEGSPPESNAQQEHHPAIAPSEPSKAKVDWEALRRELEEWYSKADEDATLVRGLHEQHFLLSKSKIVAGEDREELKFCTDPAQDKAGIVFIMPQNKWCISLDEVMTTIEKAYNQRAGYMKKSYIATGLEQVSGGNGGQRR